MRSDRAAGPAFGWRILIAGTGGQGVLTAARLLCECFVERGHEVVSGQLHGMAQRGGSVHSTVVIDGGISPVIPGGRADCVLGFEPVETARAMPFMSARTVVFMNTTPVVPFVVAQGVAGKKEDAGYPDVQFLCDTIKAVAAQTLAFDASRCATDAGSAQSLNMVMLGCLLGSGSLPCGADDFWTIASSRMPSGLRRTNERAFGGGSEVVRQLGATGGRA